LILTVLIVTSPGLASAVHDPIDEIFVTATRRPTSTSQISSASSLVDGQTVQKQQLTTDALRSLVGVFVQQTTPGQGAAIIRGLRGSSILHLVDGMRLNNAIFRSAPTQYLALVPTSAVDRIEVIRGIPAALYGSEAVGGVVQVVSRIPVFDSSTTKVRREFQASLDTAELQKSLSAVIDAGTKNFASSFSAQYLQTGNRRTGGGERISPSGFDSKSARAVFVATPTDQHSWLLDVQMLEQPMTPRVDELVPGFGQTQPSSSEFFFAPNQRLFAHAQHTRSDTALGLDWRFDAAWQRIVDDRVTRDFAASKRLRESNRSDLTGLTVSASGESSGTSWIVGAEIYHDQVRSKRNEEDTTTGERQPVPSRFPDGSTVTQSAIYGSLDRRLSAKHIVSGGLRFSSVKVSLPGTGVTSAESLSVSNPSGDLGWIYNASDRWQFVANLGVGFRAPNVFDLGTLGNRPGNRFNIPNTALDSEHVLQGDIGVRFISDRRQFSIVLFSLRYEDRITSVLTGDVTPEGRDIVQSINAANSSIRGVEAGFTVNVTAAVSAHAILNYARGEQRIVGENREPADRIPPLNGRLSLTLDHGGAWKLESWIASAGRQNRLSARDIRDARVDPMGTAGWGTVGASAQWSPGGGWQISASIENLFDKRYRSHGSGLDEPGRNLSLNVRRAW
jgi:outer membrane receptor protein involved in Fe transport